MPSENAELLPIRPRHRTTVNVEVFIEYDDTSAGDLDDTIEHLIQQLAGYHGVCSVITHVRAPASPATEGHVLCKIAEVHDTKCASPSTVPAENELIKMLRLRKELDPDAPDAVVIAPSISDPRRGESIPLLSEQSSLCGDSHAVQSVSEQAQRAAQQIVGPYSGEVECPWCHTHPHREPCTFSCGEARQAEKNHNARIVEVAAIIEDEIRKG